MTFEDEVRGALAAEAKRYPVPPVPGRALERRGQARRLRRRTALGSAAVTLAAAPVATIVLQSGDVGVWGSDKGGAASSTGTTVTTARPTAPLASRVRVVEPGERANVAAPNITMSLDRSGYCVHVYRRELGNESHQCKSAVDGNQAPGISLQSGRDEKTQWSYYSYYSGLYIGDETPSRIVVSTDQGELTATILTLPGKPGWVAYTVADESTSVPTGPRPSAGVTAYDENGRVLDELTRH